MPLLMCSEDPLPEWSDLDSIEIIIMKKGESLAFYKKSLKEKFFICEGISKITLDAKSFDVKRGDIIDLNNASEKFQIKSIVGESVIIRVAGRWGSETGSCGVFSINSSNNPKNTGDPVDYPRNTEFDNHYHDCDEYWIIFKGAGAAVSEGKRYQLKPGYFLATKMGEHHDLPVVEEEIHGVWFETTLKGKGRTGHLWDHTHSK